MTERNNVVKLRQRGGRGWKETTGEIYRHIMQGREFVSGAMKATQFTNRNFQYDYTRAGELPTVWREVLRVDRPDYVVTSYETPIAWHVANDGDGDDERWVIPDVRYSATTTRHQNLVRTALVFDRKPYVESLSDA